MADIDAIKERSVGALKQWLGENESRTAVCVALILSEKLKAKFPLDDGDLDTGGGQVPGLSGGNVQRILERHGITKKYSAMGGRTTRSSTPLARTLVDNLRDWAELTDEERNNVVFAMEACLVGRVQSFFSRQKLEVAIDLSKPGPVIIADILRAADEKKIGGQVAQHLIGAKLARKFPHKHIDNFPATAADSQLDRDGDFAIEEGAFHVSVSPMPSHVQRCKENLANGRKPYLIVPVEKVEKAKAYVEAEHLEGRVAIVSIEQFVGQNVDELGEFDQVKTRSELAALLKEYNRRVAEAETDHSVQIVIPKNIDAER